jgi:ribonuclease D
VSGYILEMNLKKLGELYLGIELDKTVRGKIIYAGLTDEVVVYSALDVKYLEKLMEAQKKKLKEQRLLNAIKYENAFTVPLAYMEYCGVKINTTKWKAKMEKDNQRKQALEEQLNK